MQAPSDCISYPCFLRDRGESACRKAAGADKNSRGTTWPLHLSALDCQSPTQLSPVTSASGTSVLGEECNTIKTARISGGFLFLSEISAVSLFSHALFILWYLLLSEWLRPSHLPVPTASLMYNLSSSIN